MTEQEFVLNNYYAYCTDHKFGYDEESIEALKLLYKAICENTSDGKTVSIEVKKIDDIMTYITENATASIERNVVPMLENLKKGEAE